MARVSPQGGRSPSAARPAWCTTRVSAGQPGSGAAGGSERPGHGSSGARRPSPPAVAAGTPRRARRLGWARRCLGRRGLRAFPGGRRWRSCRCPVAVARPRCPRPSRSLFNERVFPKRIQPSFWECTGERSRRDAGAQMGGIPGRALGAPGQPRPLGWGRPGPKLLWAPRVPPGSFGVRPATAPCRSAIPLPSPAPVPSPLRGDTRGTRGAAPDPHPGVFWGNPGAGNQGTVWWSG